MNKLEPLAGQTNLRRLLLTFHGVPRLIQV